MSMHAVKVAKTVAIVGLIEIFKQVHDLIPYTTWSITSWKLDAKFL